MRRKGELEVRGWLLALCCGAPRVAGVRRVVTDGRFSHLEYNLKAEGIKELKEENGLTPLQLL